MPRWPTATARALPSMAEVERSKAPGRAGLAEAAARGYYKLLAYKDEYEVARLFTDARLREGARRTSSRPAASSSSIWRRRCWPAATSSRASRAR